MIGPRKGAWARGAAVLARFLHSFQRPGAFSGTQPGVGAIHWVRVLAGAALVLVALPASAADPMRVALGGAQAYETACRDVAGAANGAALQRARWSAASDLLAAVHPRATLRTVARHCLRRLDESTTAGERGAADKVSRLHARLSALEMEFERRLTEDAPRVEFEGSELGGFPSDWLQEFRVGSSSRFAFDLAPAHYYPFMALVDSADARRRMYVAHANRGGLANVRVLQQIAELRLELAQLHGHRSYGELLAHERKAPSPAGVAAFLDQLAVIIEPVAARDIEFLGAADPSSPVRRWDMSRLLEQSRGRYVGQGEMWDPSRVPAKALGAWLTGYFGRLAGVHFRPAAPAFWHESATCYEVHDEARSEPRGRLCLDLAPRPGKYYNYATYVLPEDPPAAPRTAVLLANVLGDKLSPDEVERVFGEFSVALSSLTCRLETCRLGSDRSLARWRAVQRSLFSLLAFSDESLGVLKASSVGVDLLGSAEAKAIQENRDFAVGLARMRDLQIARFDHELSRATGAVSVLGLWVGIEQASPLGYEPGSYLPSRLNALTGAAGGLNFYTLWAEAVAQAVLEATENTTLQAPTAQALRAAFFEPAAGVAPEQRLERLTGHPFSMSAFARMIEKHSIVAVAGRRSTLTRTEASHGN